MPTARARPPVPQPSRSAPHPYSRLPLGVSSARARCLACLQHVPVRPSPRPTVRPPYRPVVQLLLSPAHLASRLPVCQLAARLATRSRACQLPRPFVCPYIKRQILKTSLREWQQMWTTTAKGQEYRNTAQRQRDWGPSWKPTKLITGSDQTTTSTIHQLRLGHGYFRSFLLRLPSYDSTQCQCSERVQNVKHLLLGCTLYQDERRHAGITRETTLHSLLFTRGE